MTAQQGFPKVTAPFVFADGRIQQAWLQLLIALWNRTGGGPGTPELSLGLPTGLPAAVALSVQGATGLSLPISTPPVIPQDDLAALAFSMAFSRRVPTGGDATLSGLLLPASENLASGALVNVWDNSGVASFRNANGATTGKKAHAFVLSAASSGAFVQGYSAGQVISGLSGLTPGATEYLAASAGATTETPLSTSGQLSQEVGVALSSSSMLFLPGPAIAL